MKNAIKTIFENIKTLYGDVASWAVWKPHNGNNLMSNMEVDGLFDLDTNFPCFFASSNVSLVSPLGRLYVKTNVPSESRTLDSVLA
ncbi:MAG: hypothetical protein U5L00_02710 [Desulfovermiculus sp.]|nr:hypothetical protein [Desulfovermiculus sp.]